MAGDGDKDGRLNGRVDVAAATDEPAVRERAPEAGARECVAPVPAVAAADFALTPASETLAVEPALGVRRRAASLTSTSSDDLGGAVARRLAAGEVLRGRPRVRQVA